LKDLPLEIDDTGGLTIGKLALRARALKKRKGLELLVVDYLQLLSGSNQRRNDNRALEVSDITKGLKALAKELQIPIIALSQISRNVDSRDNPRPQLADLRESGAIEEDADEVMMVYRQEYYLSKRKPPQEGTEAWMAYERDQIRCKGIAEVIIAKNRHGATGSIELGFDGAVTSFLNEPEERELMPEPPNLRKERKNKLPADATLAFGAIKSASLGPHAIVPTDEQRRRDHKLKKLARLVPVDVARSKFSDDLGPVEDEKELRRRFSAGVKLLQKAGIAYWTRGENEDEWFVWLPELVD
jgi:replicative DNA helicase